MLLEDPVLLVIILLRERLIDVYRAGRSGGPFTDKEVLYGKRGKEPVIPGSEARSFGHGGGGRGKREVRMIGGL